MTRMLVTGAGGMVGREVVELGQSIGWDMVGRTRRELDVTDPEQVHAALAAAEADVVLNAAAYTRVDAAEAEPDLARQTNAEGPGRLAESCAERGIPLIQISTDYVFDGSERRPYRPDHPAHPLNVYGRTKWDGEVAIRTRLEQHVIVRTSWVFAPCGRNFLTSIVARAREQATLRVVADQQGSPTLASDLARALLEVASQAVSGAAPWGTYHFCNAGETSWHQFALAIVRALAARGDTVVEHVIPITTAEYPTAAVRPAYSVLDTTSWTATFGRRPRPWQEALSDALCQLS